MKLSVQKETKSGLVLVPTLLLSLGGSTLASAGGPPEKDAQNSYKAKCAVCHASSGSGDTTMGKKMKLRDLRSTEVQKQSDIQLYEVIAKGKGKMPAYEKQLGKEKIQDLINYVRELAKKQ